MRGGREGSEMEGARGEEGGREGMRVGTAKSPDVEYAMYP